jgi:molybdenum cofactor cytidylyltransferase
MSKKVVLVAGALAQELACQGADDTQLIIFGASAIADRRDIIPSASR